MFKQCKSSFEVFGEVGAGFLWLMESAVSIPYLQEAPFALANIPRKSQVTQHNMCEILIFFLWQ